MSTVFLVFGGAAGSAALLEAGSPEVLLREEVLAGAGPEWGGGGSEIWLVMPESEYNERNIHIY